MPAYWGGFGGGGYYGGGYHGGGGYYDGYGPYGPPIPYGPPMGCYWESWVGFNPRWSGYMDWVEEVPQSTY